MGSVSGKLTTPTLLRQTGKTIIKRESVSHSSQEGENKIKELKDNSANSPKELSEYEIQTPQMAIEEHSCKTKTELIVNWETFLANQLQYKRDKGTERH